MSASSDDAVSNVAPPAEVPAADAAPGAAQPAAGVPASGPTASGSAPPPIQPPTPPTEPPTPPEPEPTQESAPQRETLADAIADLLQMVVNYLRQETAGIMRDKVVLPGQQLGAFIAFAFAAAALLVIGLCFLFVSFLMVLAYFVGWAGAFAIVGGVTVLLAGLFTYLKVRSIQT